MALSIGVSKEDDMGMQGTPFTDQVVAAVDALSCGIQGLRGHWVVTWRFSEYRKGEHGYEWVVFERKHPMSDIYIHIMCGDELYYNDDKCNFYWSPKVVSIEERYRDSVAVIRQHACYL